ncbi:unnamed protein product [Closterium sp. NIES-64]|nr:unnamed protein product [Closterium sp. NIES-64]
MCRKKCTTRLKALLLSALHSLVSNTCETPTSTYRINTLPHLQHLISWMALRGGGSNEGDEGAEGEVVMGDVEAEGMAVMGSFSCNDTAEAPHLPLHYTGVLDCSNSTSSNCIDDGWLTAAALDYMVDATRQWGLFPMGLFPMGLFPMWRASHRHSTDSTLLPHPANPSGD